MAKRSRGACQEGLGHLFDPLYDAVIAANRYFWLEYETDLHKFSPGARAFTIRDFIVDELKQRLDPLPEIKIIVQHQKTLFCVGTDWVIQPHKFTVGCMTARNDTQANLFLNQNEVEQLELSGIPEKATVVFLGYIENITERLSPEVMLSCPDGDKPAWVIELGKGTEPTPAPEITRPAPDGGTEVVVRDGKKRKIGP